MEDMRLCPLINLRGSLLVRQVWGTLRARRRSQVLARSPLTRLETYEEISRVSTVQILSRSPGLIQLPSGKGSIRLNEPRTKCKSPGIFLGLMSRVGIDTHQFIIE